MDHLTIGRRQFTLQAVLALLSGVAITVTACGSGTSTNSPPTAGPSPTPNPSPGTSDVTGTISANHGHTAVITGGQLTAANSISLNIQGTATHPHTVDLSSAEVASIASRQQVAKTSSTENGHNHTVTFN